MNIFQKVKELGIPLGSYVVFGSGPLQAHGIRESSDIDMCVTREVYDKLKDQEGWVEEVRPNGQKVILKEPFDIGVGWSYGNYKPDLSYLIKTADIINGVAFVNLDEFLKWKKEMNREKDIRDVRLVEEYLKNK